MANCDMTLCSTADGTRHGGLSTRHTIAPRASNDRRANATDTVSTVHTLILRWLIKKMRQFGYASARVSQLLVELLWPIFSFKRVSKYISKNGISKNGISKNGISKKWRRVTCRIGEGEQN
jgi:hypothetical protein